jgi:hypothetical protein
MVNAGEMLLAEFNSLIAKMMRRKLTSAEDARLMEIENLLESYAEVAV